MNLDDNLTAEEVAIRKIITNWAAAVRAKDLQGILAHHADDFLMFDVPPPLESRGIKAYQKTWDLFYSAQPEPLAFDIKRLDIVAGSDVAFAVALMQCAETDKDGQRIPLDFRLTVGLRKISGRWTIIHEHHSVPATS
ncbi:SgcJ/EcaC family oxidoreductase [bacterium]|nr:SgcJ/EcaC family oxidoreductase [bacterium]